MCARTGWGAEQVRPDKPLSQKAVSAAIDQAMFKTLLEAVSPFNKGIKAFGKIAAPSRGKRPVPYGSSELEDGFAAAHQAEQLLASTSAHLSQPEMPGGARVKLEVTSA